MIEFLVFMTCMVWWVVGAILFMEHVYGTGILAEQWRRSWKSKSKMLLILTLSGPFTPVCLIVATVIEYTKNCDAENKIMKWLRK